MTESIIKFPETPSEGDVFTLPDGRRWIYNFGAWRLKTSIAAGNPYNLNLDRYDLKITASGLLLDMSDAQVMTVDNSTADVKNVEFTAPPEGRAMTGVLEIVGSAGTIVLPENFTFAEGVDTSLGNTKTMFILFWNGTSFTVATNIKI